jgi:hypothetical protein
MKYGYEFGLWNVRSLCREGSLMILSRELTGYVRFSGNVGGQVVTCVLCTRDNILKTGTTKTEAKQFPSKTILNIS